MKETHLVSRHPGVVLVKVGLGPRPRWIAVRAGVHRLLLVGTPVHDLLLLLLRLMLVVGAVPGAVHEVPLDDLVVGAAGVLARVCDSHAAARPHYGAGQVLIHLVRVRLPMLQMRLGMVGMVVTEMLLLLLLLLQQLLMRRQWTGKVGGGGRVSEVSPAAALGVQRPVVRHGLALRQRGRRRRMRGGSAP